MRAIKQQSQRRKADMRLGRARQIFGVGLFLTALLIGGCAKGFVSISGATMGTYYSISYSADECMVDPQLIEAELNAINQSMSTYIADSELMQINQAVAGKFPVSSALAEVLSAATRLHEVTDGAFDVTIGPLVELWGFGAHEIDQAPSADAQANAAANVGMSLIHLDGQQLEKRRAQVRLDLSAIAKGYAVDQLATITRSAGCNNFMVDIGGEIRVSGNNSRGKDWRLGIESPDASQLGSTNVVIEVRDMAIATSGDYRNFQVFDEERVHHVFDPRSGTPVRSEVVSATVLGPSAMLADGFATAFLVLSTDESLAIADAEGLAVYLLYRAPDTDAGVDSVYNSNMQQYLPD